MNITRTKYKIPISKEFENALASHILYAFSNCYSHFATVTVTVIVSDWGLCSVIMSGYQQKLVEINRG